MPKSIATGHIGNKGRANNLKNTFNIGAAPALGEIGIIPAIISVISSAGTVNTVQNNTPHRTGIDTIVRKYFFREAMTNPSTIK
jgi:hypothetical protein